jgi:hypothetical protein
MASNMIGSGSGVGGSLGSYLQGRQGLPGNINYIMDYLRMFPQEQQVPAQNQRVMSPQEQQQALMGRYLQNPANQASYYTALAGAPYTSTPGMAPVMNLGNYEGILQKLLGTIPIQYTGK